jgi:surfactin family lipopeptide synthetase A
VRVPALLTELRARDIYVWVDGDKLKVNALAGALTPELREQLRQRKGEVLEFLSRPAELSFAQQRLWFLDQVEMASTAYVIPWAMRLQGPLQAGALEGALGSIVARHESLRTTVANAEGRPVQNVSAVASFSLPVVAVSGAPGRLGALLSEETHRGFDLVRGPLFRAVLYRLGPDEHVLLLLQHHIIADAWSVDVMLQELGILYRDRVRGRVSTLPELPVQYRDFSRWQREWLQGEALTHQLEYWRAQLTGAPQVLDLPADRPRPPMESHRGAIYSFTIPREVTERLGVLSRREGTTLFMVLLAAFDVLLWRYTGQEDLLVGTPVANRGRTELEGLIGLFVNTLVLRSDLSGNPTVQELLAQVRERCLDAYAHQELPLETLVENLRPERDLSRNPLFQVMLVLQNVPPHPFAAPGLTVIPVKVDRGAAQLDLTLYVQETPEGLKGTFEYATDLFDETTIERMAGHWRALLEAMLATPRCRLSDLPLLTEAERQQLLVDLNRTNKDYPRKALLHELFEAQVQRAPERTALRVEATTLSYAELDARANRIAQALRARGVGRGQRIGLCVERGPDLLAGVLGILKAGAAYVPLDPAFPENRLRFMAEDAQLALLVSTAALAGSCGLPRARQLLLDTDAAVLAAQSDQRLTPAAALDARAEDPAYVIYTSGSTGQPKGVVVPHRAVVNFLTSMAREPGLTAEDVLVAVTTLSFDIAVLELQLPLTVGATVVLASRDEASDGQALSALLEQHQATVMQATPVTWRLLLAAGWSGGTAFKALVGGEALPRDVADQLLARGVELWNLYGPTETTVWSTCAQITDTANGITIGRPIANTTVYILDAQQNLCPLGVPGELCIGGAGVALGYWNRPELTAERFIADPFSTPPGATLYRTGDRARWRHDGMLMHLGRLDDQVKLRGLRIELGEIEANLAAHPEVRQAAVHLWTVKANDVRIVACCVPAQAGVLAPVSLRKHLRARLPEYMVPQHFLLVEQIPLTPNGKVDRRRLPTPVLTESRLGRQEAPADAVETTLAEIWTKLIHPTRPISRSDKFFEMGGHSLLGLRALRQIEDQLGVRLEFRMLFQESLADLALRCRPERMD